MAGSVTGLHVFAADVGPEPLSLLDGNFNPLATAINTLSTFSNYYVDSGAVNALAITVNAPQVVASYTDGLQVQVQCANTTTSATPTLAINGLGARTLVHGDASALAIGELVAGMRFTAIYDSTLAEFRIISATYTGLAFVNPTFNATVTINAVAAKESLIVSGAAGQIAVDVLSQGGAGGVAIRLQAPATNSSGTLLFFDSTNSVTRAFIGSGAVIAGMAVADFGIAPGTSGNVLIGTANGAGIGAKFGPGGGLTLNTPSSGSTLTLNTSSGGQIISGTDGTISATGTFAAGEFNWGTASAHPFALVTGGSSRLSINAQGAVQIASPAAVQVSLTVTQNNATQAVIINGSAAEGLRIAGTAANGSFLQVYNGSTFVGFFGAALQQLTGPGTINATDLAIACNNGVNLFLGVNSTAILKLLGTTAPTIQGYGPVAAALVDMTPDKGSWTTTLSGPYTANPTGTLNWERQGTQVTIWANAAITGTATGAAGITASALPAAITPSSNRIVACGALEDNSVLGGILGQVTITSGGTIAITLMKTQAGANPVEVVGGGTFTGAGTAGILAGWSITYSL